jgi:RNA polymerase sigma-70 factor, ECF subfamily
VEPMYRELTADDSLLVSQAQDGSKLAFEALYRLHVDRVHGLCLRITGDAGHAEELTQSAFVRAWEKLSTFAGRSQFSTWLHRLTVNVVLGEWRSRSRREGRQIPLEELPEQMSPQATRRSLMKLDLEAAINGLPDRARLVFVLHDVEGYQHREIGALLEMAEGTSKAHLHRARHLLRKVLAS